MVSIALPKKSSIIVHSPVVRGMKAVPRGNGLIEGYLVSWGNPTDTDLEGQYFTPNTNFCIDWFAERPLLYHHGMDATMGVKCVGRVKSLEMRDLGLWCQAQLDIADQYGRAVYNLTETGKFGWSSGSSEHLVEVAPTGEITQWPLIEGSVTPTPAQPAKTTITALKSVLPDTFGGYLRGLHARVGTESADNNNDPIFVNDERTNTMATKSTVAFVRAVLKSQGVQATDEQCKAIADDPEVVASLGEGDPTMGLEEDPAVMGLEEDPSMMAFGEEDPAAMAFGDEDPTMAFGDEDPAVMGFGEEDPATMGLDEDPSMMAFGDEDPTMGLDEEEAVMSAYRNMMARKYAAKRSRARKSAAVPYGMTPGMQAYVAALEAKVAQNERGFGRGVKSAQVMPESADRKQAAYKAVWWKWARGGEGRLQDSERNRLYSEGGRDAQMRPIKSALNVSDVASLALAVPEDFVNDLNKNVANVAVMRNECAERQTSSDRVVMPRVTPSDARRAWSGTVFYPGENPSTASETEANDISVSQDEIPVHVHLINKSVTLSSLEDVSFDLQAELTEFFGEGIGVAYDTNIWSGNGSGKMKGVVVDPRVITSASTGTASVSGYVAAGSTTDINPDQLIAISLHLPAPHRRNAKWFMNTNTLRVIRQLKDGEGRYLWTDGNGLQFGQPKMLLDFPIVINEFADDIASGAFPIVFGDMKKAYTVVKRVEFAVRRFEDSATAATDSVSFFGRARMGGQVTSEWAVKVLKMATS